MFLHGDIRHILIEIQAEFVMLLENRGLSKEQIPPLYLIDNLSADSFHFEDLTANMQEIVTLISRLVPDVC